MKLRTVDWKHPWTLAALGFMALSLILRLIGYGPAGLSGFDWWVYLGIPALSSVWFCVSVVCWGRRTLVPSCLGVLGGVFYFFVKAFTFSHWWHTLLCCILYLTVLILYLLTVTGSLPTKKLLYPLFGLLLAVHIIQDIIEYGFHGVPLDTLLPETSVLAIMASLLCLALAMDRSA